jgi:hypothetical protein
MQKEKEKLLWEELLALRDMSFKMLQWCVTVLASLETALFFVRKDIYEKMLAANLIGTADPLPLRVFVRGTVFLFVVAVIFGWLNFRVANRLRTLRAQLVKLNFYQIEHPTTSKAARFVTLFMLLAFPIMDLFLRLTR